MWGAGEAGDGGGGALGLLGAVGARQAPHHALACGPRRRRPTLTAGALLPPLKTGHLGVKIPLPDLLLQRHDHVHCIVHDAQLGHGLV